jgi:hypothetical protein
VAALPLLKCGALLSFIGGKLVTVPSLHLPAAGKGRIKTRRYSSRRPVQDDDGAGPPSTIHQSALTTDRPRQLGQRELAAGVPAGVAGEGYCAFPMSPGFDSFDVI